MASDRETKMLTQVFVNLGSTDAQALVMAKQMLKRADQLANEKNWERSDALDHLMKVLMAGREGSVYPPIGSGKREKTD